MIHSIVEIINRKCEGKPVSDDEIAWLIAEYTADRIPEYQMSSLLMAIRFTGFSETELAAWTEAMLHSGETLHLESVGKPKIDKHSTGGVGDKVSIPLAPIVAACGIAIPMMSGRGLGHTGGTLDKLESIPGFSTHVPPDDFARQLDDIGVVMAGQSEDLVPADRRLYALRDASATVHSVPLIASSIMSKKLAEDLDGLLLDVKVGSGAFMKTRDDAEDLARTMVGIGRSHGTPVTVLLTDMSQPLGHAVGNANEIAESIDILEGCGPADATQLTYRCATEMLGLAGSVDSDTARATVERAVASGAALEVMARLIERQGGDPRVLEDRSLLPAATREHIVTASSDGWISECDAFRIGLAAVRLGAGRSKKDDAIDPGVGLTIDAKIGDAVAAGDRIARISYNDPTSLASALSVLGDAWEISPERPADQELIMGVIT